MSWIHRKALAVVVAGAAVSTILGASLGIAVAKHASTVGGVCSGGGNGCNIHYVGAIHSGSVSPANFTKCLPAADWEAIYIWDGPNQEWEHYFNETKTPAFVNATAAGGINTIPGFSGVVLIMKPGAPIQQVTLLDGNNESC
ncbi:MAG: hypothetical protein AB7N24_16620 [Dehalococcoidia bacterium]